MSQMPWPPPPGSHASITPPSFENISQMQGVQWARTQVYYPTPWIPFSNANNIGTFPRFRVSTISGQAANAVAPLAALSFDIPSIVYAISGSARDTTTPANLASLDPRDEFLFQVVDARGDQFMTAPALGSLHVGTAGRPFLVGDSTWMMTRGAALNLYITPLRANLRIDISLWCIEIHGPANYSP